MSELNADEQARKKAERDQADRKKLDALGYNADDPQVLVKYQELQDKVAAGRISQQDALRGLDKQAYDIADKERRDAAKQNNQQLQKDDGGAPDRTAGAPTLNQTTDTKEQTQQPVALSATPKLEQLFDGPKRGVKPEQILPGQNTRAAVDSMSATKKLLKLDERADDRYPDRPQQDLPGQLSATAKLLGMTEKKPEKVPTEQLSALQKLEQRLQGVKSEITGRERDPLQPQKAPSLGR